MPKHTIAVIYDEKKERETLDTFEDIQSELNCFKIPFEVKKGKKRQLVLDGCTVTFLPFQPEMNLTYQHIYASDSLQKAHGAYLKEKSEMVSYHKTSFQHLVDIVLDVKAHVKVKVKVMH